MIISELIKELENSKEKFGDTLVGIRDESDVLGSVVFGENSIIISTHPEVEFDLHDNRRLEFYVTTISGCS